MALDPKKIECFQIEISPTLSIQLMEVIEAHLGLKEGIFIIIKMKVGNKTHTVALREEVFKEIAKHAKNFSSLRGYARTARRMGLDPENLRDQLFSLDGRYPALELPQYRGASHFRKRKPSSSVRNIQKCPVIRIDKQHRKPRPADRKRNPAVRLLRTEREE